MNTTSLEDLNQYTKKSFENSKKELEKLIKEFDYKLRKYVSGTYEINIKAYSSLGDIISYSFFDYTNDNMLTYKGKGISIDNDCDRIPIKNKEDSKDIKKYMKDYYGEKYDEE